MRSRRTTEYQNMYQIIHNLLITRIGDKSQWITSHLDFGRSEVASGFVEAHANLAGEAPQHPIREAGQRVLLHQHQRNAAQNRGYGDRRRGVSSGAYHQLGAIARDQGYRLRKRAEKFDAGLEAIAESVAAQSAHRKEAVLVAASRQPLGLESRAAPDEQNVGGGPLAGKLFSERDRGEQMPSGAAACDYHLHSPRMIRPFAGLALPALVVFQPTLTRARDARATSPWSGRGVRKSLALWSERAVRTSLLLRPGRGGARKPLAFWAARGLRGSRSLW